MINSESATSFKFYAAPMSISVSVPIVSYLFYGPMGNITSVNDLLRAIVHDLYMENQKITLSKVALRTLVSGHGLQNS